MDETFRSERFQQVVTGALGHFPVGAEIEFEGSTITIPIVASLPNGWISTEEVDFKAFMRLELERRTRNLLGRTQFEFTIAVWELYGRSELLSEKFGGDVSITFSLTPPPQRQPKSICFANQDGPDFPATIIYSACYDVFMNREKIIDAQMGVAICTPIVGIPPRNVLVAFEKPFEDRKRGIAFARGCCWGMRTLRPEEFLEGANRARKVRGWGPQDDAFGSFFGPAGEAPRPQRPPTKPRRARVAR
ncbi:MAG TPA: hypothetical protein VF121_06975 [Thermoanaerobaculia bacterium]|nr:hypothetical protein [Thermoanaerobaculia bacterium]